MKIKNALRNWYLSLPASRRRLLRNILVRSALCLMILLLTVEGYYAYRFYQDSSRQTAVPPSEPGDPEPEGEAAFVHQATPQNTSANSTYLNSPLTDGDPEAIISVTQSWNPGAGPGTYNDHPIGVWYDPRVQKWAIFNQDRAPMPPGAAFNVVVRSG